jgi:hypothetical protein
LQSAPVSFPTATRRRLKAERLCSPEYLQWEDSGAEVGQTDKFVATFEKGAYDKEAAGGAGSVTAVSFPC